MSFEILKNNDIFLDFSLAWAGVRPPFLFFTRDWSIWLVTHSYASVMRQNRSMFLFRTLQRGIRHPNQPLIFPSQLAWAQNSTSFYEHYFLPLSTYCSHILVLFSDWFSASMVGSECPRRQNTNFTQTTKDSMCTTTMNDYVPVNAIKTVKITRSWNRGRLLRSR